jgi:hypothetical protein
MVSDLLALPMEQRLELAATLWDSIAGGADRP